jgi:hypothetical protein
MASSLTRGRVCNSLLLLGLASTAPLEFESRETQDRILLSQFLRLPPTWMTSSPFYLYIPQEECGPVLRPANGFPSCSPLRLAGLRRRNSNPPPHGLMQTEFHFLVRLNAAIICSQTYILGSYRDKSICGAVLQVWLTACVHPCINWFRYPRAPSGRTSPPHAVPRLSRLPTLSGNQQLSKLQQIGNTF